MFSTCLFLFWSAEAAYSDSSIQISQPSPAVIWEPIETQHSHELYPIEINQPGNSFINISFSST